MLTAAYKIEFGSVPRAIVVCEILESRGIIPDERDEDIIYLSKESLDKEGIDWEDVMQTMTDICAQSLFNEVPSIVIEDHEFDMGDDGDSDPTFRDSDIRKLRDITNDLLEMLSKLERPKKG